MLLFGFVAIANMAFAQVEEPVQEELIEIETPRVVSPPPPPPPSASPRVQKVARVAEVMPMFPGCKEDTDNMKRKICADEKMLKFIYTNLVYPESAKENKVEGTVVISFVVEKDGELTDIKVIRDIGSDCGMAALDVVKKMPRWENGIQEGRPVRVQFNLPIKFKL